MPKRPGPPNTKMPKFKITVQGVTKLLEGLNGGKAPGPVWPASSSPVQCFPLGSVRMRVTLSYGNVHFLSYTGLVVHLM